MITIIHIERLFLLDISSLMRMDILVWVIGVPVVITFIILLIFQLRQYWRLKSDLSQLSKIKRHNIEYELVLKAMKLSTWRVDVPTRVVTLESDYRDKTDNFASPSGAQIKDFYAQILPPYREVVETGMENLFTGKAEDFHAQYQMQVPLSAKVYWSETFATIDKRDVEDKPLTVVGATLRIDDRKEIERELIEARNHAEESDRLKSAFLANITHEVRTPLNAIVGFSDILPMAQSEEERNELIKLIKQNNSHLLRLFDDMMNISKLEAGGSSHVKKTDVEILPLLHELIDKYMSECREKGLDLFLEESALNDVVFTDGERLKEILNQYLNNAVKFTSEGSVSVGYDKHPHDIRIWVSDTGKGIPEDKCNEHLFERFVKVDEFIPGTGLGLSICRSLAKSIDGKIGVESVYGKGSVFWVELPV